jgi:hypothetical protein
MYATEPIIHAGVTSWQNLIVESGFKIWSGDQRTQQEIDRILNQTNFNEVFLEYNTLHLAIFGDAFTEPLWDKETKTEILGWNPVNPCTMDFDRDDTTGEVLYDEYGREAGYHQTLFSGDEHDFTPDELFHINLYQANRGQLGLGFVEPIYTDTELKENIEQARANEAFARANRIPIVKYSRPSAELKKRSEDFAKSLVDPNTEWAAFCGQEMEISWLEPPKIESEMITQLMYVTKLQAAVLRIPVSVLMRTVIDERGSLEDLLDFFEYDFKAFQHKLKIRESIIKAIRLENENRENDKIPVHDINIEYGKLSQKSIKEIIMRIMRMGKAGLLDPKDPEVAGWLKGHMGIATSSAVTPSKDSKGVIQ